MDQLSYLPTKSQGKFSSAERLLPVKGLRSNHIPNQLAALDTKLIGDSSAMLELKQAISSIAKSSETVLITGESGTGKELIARAIHELSARSSGPYVPVNCGALNESLLESELFGHMKGSFTGAATNKKGFFESARSGTIFLDEFAEMSLGMQQRLLRILQERTVRPVGRTDPEEIQIDTRIVVATNHDLKRDIAEGKFRQDLFYRVNVLQIHSPALRDRKQDILPLAKHFLQKYNRHASAVVSETIPIDVLAALERYSWPGNVRELENIIKRLSVSAASEAGSITGSLLRRVPELHESMEATSFRDDADGLYEVTRKANCMSGKNQERGQCRCAEFEEYRQLLNQADGNLAAVARQLKIPRTTLRHRLIALRRKCSVP